MIEAPLAIKATVLLALSSVLLMGGAYVEAPDQQVQDRVSPEIIQNLDPYTNEVLRGAGEVNNSVQELVFQYGKQERWEYRQSYENTIILIRNENLEAQQAYQKLDPDKKEINRAYRAYLHEAALVAYSNYVGEPQNTSIMIQANTTLNNLAFKNQY